MEVVRGHYGGAVLYRGWQEVSREEPLLWCGSDILAGVSYVAKKRVHGGEKSAVLRNPARLL